MLCKYCWLVGAGFDWDMRFGCLQVWGFYEIWGVWIWQSGFETYYLKIWDLECEVWFVICPSLVVVCENENYPASASEVVTWWHYKNTFIIIIVVLVVVVVGQTYARLLSKEPLNCEKVSVCVDQCALTMWDDKCVIRKWCLLWLFFDAACIVCWAGSM